MYVIESDGPAATPGMNRVIDPQTNKVLMFGTRAEARRHADDIRPAQPSKYLPLVVREMQPCFCPDDCNCHHPWRPNYCGCRNH